MSKPEKNKSSGIACLIDGILTRRVQTLGSSVDITREQIQELANEGVVEYIADSPTVSIQIDTNDVGSIDTMALITDKMLTYTDINDNGPREGIGNMYQWIHASSSNSAAKPITQSDMLNGYCSIIATVNEDGTAAARTMVMNHAAVTGVSLSYDVNGNAAENYTLTADNKTWFANEWANVRCYKVMPYQIQSGHGATAGAGDISIGFYNLDSAIPDDSTVVAVGINNFILRKRGFGVTGNAAFTNTEWEDGGVQGAAFFATTYALSTPFMSSAAGTTDRAWIYFVPPNQTLWESSSLTTDIGWELEASSGAVGALRRGNIKAYLWNTTTLDKTTYGAAGKALRLQTISIDIALGEEQLFELGTDGFYGISKNTPVPITVTVTANDSDLEYFAAMGGRDIELSTTNTLDITDFNGSNSLRLEIYQDKAQTISLKTIEITKMYVQAENFNVSVGDNASNEMTFTTDNITITGTGVNVTGGPNNVPGV